MPERVLHLGRHFEREVNQTGPRVGQLGDASGIHGEVVSPGIRCGPVRNLRAFLWIGVVFSAILVVLAPIVYLYTSLRLPQLESEFDLERGRELERSCDDESSRSSLLAGCT